MTAPYVYVSIIEVATDDKSVMLLVTATDEHGVTIRWFEHAFMVDGIAQSDVFGVQVVDVPAPESEAAA